jgi:CheY-like chemotaxis protein
VAEDTRTGEASVEALRTSYSAHLPDKVRALRATAALLEEGRRHAEELSNLAHRLAGSAAIYRFDLLSQAARRLEEYLRPYAEGDAAPGPHQKDNVARLVDEIAARAAEPDPATSMHVLLVDDDSDVLDYLTAHLRAAGVRVQTAQSGDEGLHLLALTVPDLIVADVRMPGLSGYDFCRRVREEGHTEIPFIFCSALGSVPERIQGLAVGADDYVVKPTDPAELLLRMRTLVEKKRRVMRLLQAAEERRTEGMLTGSLVDVPLPEVLQIVKFLRMSQVCLVVDSGSDQGRVWVGNGRIRHAEVRDLLGTKALFRILGWTRGGFRVEHAANDGPETVSRTIDECLLEGLAHHDEYRELRRRVTQTGDYLAVDRDPALLSRRFEERTAGVLSLIEKHHHLDEVLDRSPLSDLDVVRIVLELLQTAVITARPARRQSPGA